MHCWECGEWLEFEDDFCPECGADPDGSPGDSIWDEDIDYSFYADEEDYH